MKPIILTFTACYLPGFRGGGPIRTIANLVSRLGNEFDFRIVTTDRDLGDRHPYKSVSIDAWNTVGAAQVFYASSSMCSLRSIAQLLRETPHDLLYLNSFFDPVFTLKPMLVRRFARLTLRPTIVAPRGEFSEGALNLKRWKKAPFVKLARLVGLFERVVWHASTSHEAADIQRVMSWENSEILDTFNISVALDLVAEEEAGPSDRDSSRRNDTKLEVCFLSRISPKKNLAYALDVLSKVKSPIRFNIYGPKESAAYWDECAKLVSRLPPHVTVVYGGSVDPTQVRNVIARHDVFFVPTLGENFGHVFIEALSAGVPLIVSDQTPWRDLEVQQLGWDIPLGKPEEFVHALEAAANLDGEQRTLMRRRCVAFARNHSEDKKTVEMNRRLFLDALKRG